MTINYLKITIRAFIYFLVLFAFSFLLPTSVYTLVGAGLNPSWQIALNLAFEKQLIFGRDFLFTYGPLGFLSARLPFVATKSWVFYNDLFLLPSVGFCMYQLARRIETVAEAMVLVIACIVTGGVIVYMDLSIVLLFLVLLFTMLYLDQKNIFYLVWAAPLGVLCFFVKLNMGLVAVCAVFFFSIVDAVRFKSFKRAVITLGAPAILLRIGALVLPVRSALVCSRLFWNRSWLQ